MMLIATGFLAVFVLSFWLSARAGSRRQSALVGLLVGLVGFVALLGAYVTALTLWVRASLIAFIETELPMMLERLVKLADQVRLLKETI